LWLGGKLAGVVERDAGDGKKGKQQQQRYRKVDVDRA